MSINFAAGTSGLTFLARDCPGRVGLGLGLGAERVLDAAAPTQRFSIPCTLLKMGNNDTVLSSVAIRCFVLGYDNDTVLSSASSVTVSSIVTLGMNAYG